MTWADFKARILTYLDVDATRRGITALRESFIKGAVIDLKHFIPCTADGIDNAGYLDTDIVPFYPYEEKAAEAVGYYVKSKLSRVVNRDLSLMASYWDDYKTARRQLIRDCKDTILATTNVTACKGDTVPFAIEFKVTETGEPWTDFTDYVVDFILCFCGKTKLELSSTDETQILALGDTATWQVDTTDFERGSYHYRISLKNTTNDRVIKVQSGKLIIT